MDNFNSNSFSKVGLSNDIPDIDLSKLPQFDYDALNSRWYDPKIEMLIITPDSQAYVNAVMPLMEWKNHKGVKTIILSNYSDYTGTDNAEQVRNMIKEYYKKENIQWVLLVGDADGLINTTIPIREVWNPDVTLVKDADEHTSYDDEYKPTDYYYADLNGSWDNNRNSKWGESSVYTDTVDEIEWIPEVYVGRFPANNANQLKDMVNKTLQYEIKPYFGAWMRRMLLAGSVSSFDGIPKPSITDEDEARLTEYIWKHNVYTKMNFTHLYKTTGSFTPDSPPSPNNNTFLTTDNFDSELDKGYSTIFFAGHGDPTRFCDADTTFYTKGEASSCANTNMPSLIYADACTTAPIDKESDDNMGENLIRPRNKGAIGFIGATRVTWYLQLDYNLEKLNRGHARLFWEEFFEEKKFQQGKALYDSKVSYMNSPYLNGGGGSLKQEWERKNMLTYHLLGDPEVDIYTKKPVNATDPFKMNIYEGQKVTIPVRDDRGSLVYYAKVHLRTSDGKYYTAYSNRYGLARFHLTAQANETYNVTITGHNLIPSYFNFTTLPDEVEPELINLEYKPKDPTVSDNVCFNIEAFDSYSGVEGVFVLISNNGFKDYTYYRLSNDSQEEEYMFECEAFKLDPGEYSYLFVARDYVNNTKILYKNSFTITIPLPLMDYVLIIVSILIIAVAGVSVFAMAMGMKNYKRTFRRFEENI